MIPDFTTLDPIKMESMIALAAQSVNPEGLIRILLRQFTQALELWETSMEWREIALSQALTYPTGEDKHTVFWKTLQATVYVDGEDQTKERHDEFFRDLEARRDRCLKLLSLTDFDDPWATIKAIMDSLAEFASGSSMEMIWKQFLCADVVLERAVMRRLGRTANGYLALLPFDTEPTDTVVLLQGGKTPYVVRRREGCWEFVGDCYVHGIMDGEAWNESILEDMVLI
jgi:hypothetical protein